MMKYEKTILIVGGFGVVGRQIVSLLTELQPEWRLIIGSRNINRDKKFVQEHPNITTYKIDIYDQNPLENLEENVDLIIVSLNDLENKVFKEALEKKIPLLDLTRWPARVEEALDVYGKAKGESAVYLSSGWLASLPSILAKKFRDKQTQFEQIDIDILLSTQDMSGPESSNGFQNMTGEFAIYEKGSKKKVKGLSSPKEVDFSVGTFISRRLNVAPEHISLVESGIARGVSVRMAYDPYDWQEYKDNHEALTESAKDDAVVSQYNDPSSRATNDTPAHHEFILTLEKDNNMRKTLVSSEKGQSFLTAVSVTIQAIQILTKQLDQDKPADIYYPEEIMDADVFVNYLDQFDLVIKYS